MPKATLGALEGSQYANVVRILKKCGQIGELLYRGHVVNSEHRRVRHGSRGFIIARDFMIGMNDGRHQLTLRSISRSVAIRRHIDLVRHLLAKLVDVDRLSPAFVTSASIRLFCRAVSGTSAEILSLLAMSSASLVENAAVYWEC